jgi:magnesium transporter
MGGASIDSLRVRLARETAQGHLAREVPIAAPEDTAQRVFSAITGRPFEAASHIAVLDSGRLVGLVGIERLLAASGSETMSELMDPDPPIVAPGADQEVAAWKATRHGEASLAVVDGDGRFVGLIPAPRLLNVLLAEHDEDIARLGGFLHDADAARHASEEPVLLRFRHRLPWLLVGLAGMFAGAEIVAAFERQLTEHVMVMFFVPAIVYLADAVGTQTETVTVRGLSVGVGIRRIAVREALTGVAVGATLALAFMLLCLLRWGDLGLSISVGVALFAAASTATVVAMGLPWLLQRAGFDPAFGSGPIATVIQDLLSIALYFGAVTLIL